MVIIGTEGVNVSVLCIKFRPYRLNIKYRLFITHAPKKDGRMMIINGMYINRIVLVPQGQQKEKEPGTLQESDKRGEWHLK